MKTKLLIIGMVTMLMAIGFGIMFSKGVYIPCIILACVWVAYLAYFGFRVKTIES